MPVEGDVVRWGGLLLALAAGCSRADVTQISPAERETRANRLLPATAAPTTTPPLIEPEVTAPSSAGVLADRCDSDADCAPGAQCERAAPGQTGPAHGYCTWACQRDSDCQDGDAAAACRGGLCRRGCTLGVLEPGALKCLTREDLVCESATERAALDGPAPDPLLGAPPALGLCLPRCRHAGDCPAQSCDLLTGLCTDAPRGGEPIGAFCSAADDCAGGTCLERNGGRTCSAACRFGSIGCGELRDDRASAACQGRLSSLQIEGDLGYCQELCDVATDCAQLGARCDLFPRPVGGRRGACSAPARRSLGGPCSTASDCQPELACFRTDAATLSPGPAGGYCSSACTTWQDCAASDPGSVCGPHGFCLQGCTLGPETAGAGKCGGRIDVACAPVADGVLLDLRTILDIRILVATPEASSASLAGKPGACHPQCRSDLDCAPLACDLVAGVCGTPVPGLGLAALCQADSDCAGFCKYWPRVRSICGAYCRIGEVGCGYDASVPTRKARCMPPDNALGNGDRGQCLESCNVRSDCVDTGAICVSGGTTGGYRGYCAP